MRKDSSELPTTRMDAREARKILEGTGLSLTDAAKIATQRSAAVQVTSIEQGKDGFLRSCLQRNLRPSSFKFYDVRLLVFSDAFPDHTLDNLSRPDLRRWLMDLPVRASTRAGYFRAVRSLYNWANQQDPPLCMNNPTDGLKLEEPLAENQIDILNTEEASKIMEAAGPFSAMLALMLFAGVRPEEIHAEHKPPLAWGQIDLSNRIIRINAQQSKTRKARPLEELPDNLWKWLKGGVKDEPVAPGRSRQAVTRAKNAIGRWSPDICRHSFISYHLALTGDIGKTMLIAGHQGSPNMIYQHYRGVALKSDAVKYFSIRP